MYKEEDLRECVFNVYRKRGNEGYASMKTDIFLQRCRNRSADSIVSEGKIEDDAVSEIAYAMLDAQAEGELMSLLASKRF